MRLTNQQLKSYADNGFLFLPDYFSGREIALIKNEVPTLFAEDTPRRVVEKNGVVRSVYGSHVNNEQQFLGSPHLSVFSQIAANENASPLLSSNFN